MSTLTATIMLIMLSAMSVITGRCIARQKNIISATAIGGAIIILYSVGMMAAMHYLEIPIKTAILIPAYISIGVITAAVYAVTCRRLPWEITPDITKILLPGLALFIIIILPYTHFTGIDTYKWQDLATAINVEQNIPWLIHPLSLLGFTPRSYPSAQPIMLAAIQITGNLGIEPGFGVLSIFTAIIGCAAAYLFGLKAFDKPRTASIYALLYIYTPVFTRYTHWATGRGLFLALFPLLLALLINNKNFRAKEPTPASKRLAFILYPLAFISISLLLALSHKVGFIMALAAIPLYLLGLLIPKHSTRTAIAISIIPFAVLALAIVPRTLLPFPAGNALGIIRYSITRFGLLMPLALYGMLAPKDLFAAARRRKLYPLMLPAIPLAFEHHMYGALIAAPMITLAAAPAVEQLLSSTKKYPRLHTSAFIVYLLSFSLLPALAAVIHRSLIATPDRIYNAAMFLEKYDPLGPFTVSAPGRARTQIQAYVSGCPRFNINAATNLTIKFNRPPALNGHPSETIENWISYMRGFISIPKTSTDWYGTNPASYYFTIDKKGSHPQDTSIIYDKDNVRIYTKKLQ